MDTSLTDGFLRRHSWSSFGTQGFFIHLNIRQKIKLFLLLLMLLLETLQQYLHVGRIKYSSLLQVLLCDVTGKETEQ